MSALEQSEVRAAEALKGAGVEVLQLRSCQASIRYVSRCGAFVIEDKMIRANIIPERI